MKAVSHFRTLDAAAALAAANKRVSNILAKSDEVLSDRVNASTLKEPEEIKVMVMVDDKELRLNRLTMLEKLRELFLRVADISLLQ